MKHVVAPVLLLAALAFGQTWVVEQLDSTAASESPVELVKAADGRLWAGYQTRSGAARVACLSESGWAFTDVCSPAGLPWTGKRPFLAASPNGEICLACYDSSAVGHRLFRMIGDTWRSEPQPYGDSNPLSIVAYDTAGRLYTAFEPAGVNFWVAHETDSGWTANSVVWLPYYAYWFLFDVGYLTAAADGSPWFFGFSGWDDGPYKWDYETELMHFSEDTWRSVWSPGGNPVPPIPLVLVPHGDGVGNLNLYENNIQCDSEAVMGWEWNSYLAVAGLAYTVNDVPLVAVVPLAYDQPQSPSYAYKTNFWHTQTIPGPAGCGGIDIETDTAGQVVVVYSTLDSGLWCARGSDVVGVSEVANGELRTANRGPTVLSGSSVQSLQSKVFFDAMGRRVRNPRSGIFFVREAVSCEPSAVGAPVVRKVVITR